jgi:hypothetical protein
MSGKNKKQEEGVGVDELQSDNKARTYQGKTGDITQIAFFVYHVSKALSDLDIELVGSETYDDVLIEKEKGKNIRVQCKSDSKVGSLTILGDLKDHLLYNPNADCELEFNVLTEQIVKLEDVIAAAEEEVQLMLNEGDCRAKKHHHQHKLAKVIDGTFSTQMIGVLTDVEYRTIYSRLLEGNTGIQLKKDCNRIRDGLRNASRGRMVIRKKCSEILEEAINLFDVYFKWGVLKSKLLAITLWVSCYTLLIEKAGFELLNVFSIEAEGRYLKMKSVRNLGALFEVDVGEDEADELIKLMDRLSTTDEVEWAISNFDEISKYVRNDDIDPKAKRQLLASFGSALNQKFNGSGVDVKYTDTGLSSVTDKSAFLRENSKAFSVITAKKRRVQDDVKSE